MSYTTDENTRVSKLYTPSSLKDKTVSIIGCGAGGEVAFRLMQSGIRKLNLIDYDTLESHNLIRHLCGPQYVGQKKVHAVANLLTQYNPNIEVNTYDIDIMDNWETLNEIAKSTDLFVVLTDTDKSRFYINESCCQNKKMAIYGAMYDQICGGEIFWQFPETPCYVCFRSSVGNHELILKYKNAHNKKDCSSQIDPIAMPGLGIDQGVFNSIFSRICLDLLLKNIDHKLTPLIDEHSNCLIFSLTGIGNFEPNKLSSFFTNIKQHKDCIYCL